MLLRSVTRHVRDQNWFAVWVDFLIVVVGVFIGIQVANWNEHRLIRAEERLLVERIATDFSQHKQSIAYSRASFQQLADTLDDVVEALKGDFSDDEALAIIEPLANMDMIAPIFRSQIY